MSKRTAFTLVELLVVIAIIAIIAAILFPVFSKVQEKARQTSCLSNCKQQATAVLMYVEDYDEQFPLSGYTSDWWHIHTTIDVVQPYAKSRQVFICPSAPTEFRVGWFELVAGGMIVESPDSYISYQYNYELFEDGNIYSPPNGHVPIRLAEIEWPVETAMLYDGTLAMNAELNSPFLARHNEVGNANFVDGHAKTVHGKEVATTFPTFPALAPRNRNIVQDTGPYQGDWRLQGIADYQDGHWHAISLR